MGLDMYLYAEKYVSGWDHNPAPEYDVLLDALGVKDYTDAGSPSVTVSFPIGYWRKANAVHKWFVDNVQDGVDECQKVEVSVEQLTKLRELAQTALNNPHRVGELLPTTEGFFFGGTEYDEWYRQGLEETVRILAPEKLQALTDAGWYFSYQSSW